MRFVIEIPDQLIQPTAHVSQPLSPTDSTAPSQYAASDAMSGGAGPEMAGGVAVSSVQTAHDALSAGSAEQPVAPIASSAAGTAINDGGAALTE
jgi:hypothetical protein